MMSMQSSTHSSQMNTVGPAISLRTSCCDLPQNEQYRVFFESPDLLMRTPPPDAGAPHPWILDSAPPSPQGQRTLCDMGMSKRQRSPRYTTTEFLAKGEETAVFTGQCRCAANFPPQLVPGSQILP